MAVMTPSAQQTAINWLKARIEMARRDQQFVSGLGQELEILETLQAMIERGVQIHDLVASRLNA